MKRYDRRGLRCGPSGENAFYSSGPQKQSNSAPPFMSRHWALTLQDEREIFGDVSDDEPEKVR